MQLSPALTGVLCSVQASSGDPSRNSHHLQQGCKTPCEISTKMRWVWMARRGNSRSPRTSSMVSSPAWWHLGPAFSWGARPGTQPKTVGLNSWMGHKSKLRKGLLRSPEGGQRCGRRKAGLGGQPRCEEYRVIHSQVGTCTGQ